VLTFEITRHAVQPLSPDRVGSPIFPPFPDPMLPNGRPGGEMRNLHMISEKARLHILGSRNQNMEVTIVKTLGLFNPIFCHFRISVTSSASYIGL
jgi:hypothetical protein